MKQHIVYIMSLVRSGSTFLEFLLCTHPQIIGVGEIGLVLREYTRTGGPLKVPGRCTCGELPESCPCWGPILKNLSGMSLQEGFRQVLRHFTDVFPQQVLIDSSKSLEFFEEGYLSYLSSRKKPQIYPKVLFLVRDFRGWIVSIKKHLLKDNKANVWNSNAILNSYRWMHINFSNLRRIRRSGVPFLLVYYEHLIFDTQNQLQRICDFLEIENSFQFSCLGDATVHELYGSSTMKRDPHHIKYDATWMQEPFLLLYGPLVFPVALFNSWYAKKAKIPSLKNRI